MTHIPHDALFKAAFEKPENAAAELRAVLPSALARLIEWRSLALAPGSFVDPNLADEHSDLLFSARFAKGNAYVYLLFEHQSTVDHFLPLRMLSYIVRIWERFKEETPGAPHLPPILPVVLHHSKSGWTATLRLGDLIRPNAHNVPELAGLLPELRLLIDDISRVDDETLDARSLPPFAALTLWALRDGRWLSRLRRTVDGRQGVFRALRATPGGKRAIEQIFRYIAEATKKLNPSDLRTLISQAVPGAEDSIMTTLAQRWQREGLEQGLEQGRAAHEAAAVLEVLDARGLTVTATQRQRITSCTDLETLTRWLRRAVTAASTDDVFV